MLTVGWPGKTRTDNPTTNGQPLFRNNCLCLKVLKPLLKVVEVLKVVQALSPPSPECIYARRADNPTGSAAERNGYNVNDFHRTERVSLLEHSIQAFAGMAAAERRGASRS